MGRLTGDRYLFRLYHDFSRIRATRRREDEAFRQRDGRIGELLRNPLSSHGATSCADGKSGGTRHENRSTHAASIRRRLKRIGIATDRRSRSHYLLQRRGAPVSRNGPCPLHRSTHSGDGKTPDRAKQRSPRNGGATTCRQSGKRQSIQDQRALTRRLLRKPHPERRCFGAKIREPTDSSVPPKSRRHPFIQIQRHQGHGLRSAGA